LPAILLAVFSVLAAGLVAPAAAGAAAGAQPAGRFSGSFQYRDGTVRVSGFAYDRNHPTKSITVCVVANGKCLRKVRANRASAAFNRPRHIGGNHAFRSDVRRQRSGATLSLRTFANGHLGKRLDRVRVQSPGTRIINIAKRYVGHARYAEGGSSPQQGFDCSGYTAWAYAHARVATLPHSAEGQRHVPHMHPISRANARPGDLVFYFNGGGSAYHVAIYAGHGKQYAAATPQDGIRYQNVWSSDVEYRTNWH
jgi:hypothetical protein